MSILETGPGLRRDDSGPSTECHTQSLRNGRGNCAVHRLRIARRVNQRATGGVVGGDLAETLAQSLMDRTVETLEPICRGPCGGAGKAHLDRQIEDQCQIRGKITKSKTVQCCELVEHHPFAMTLIGECRIGEPIGYDPYSLREGRQDYSGDMVAPRGNEQQRFADRVPALALAFKQKPADRLGAGRSSRLASCPYWDPALAEGLY